MALEVVVLDKDEYKALIDNQADKDELEYLKACQTPTSFFGQLRRRGQTSSIHSRNFLNSGKYEKR